MNRHANWISRGSPGPPDAIPARGWTVLKIWPKLDEATSGSGVSKLARLKILNISARNSMALDSEIRKRRSSEKSQSASPGPRRMFRPALPKAQSPPVFTNGFEKEDARTHCLGACFAG